MTICALITRSASIDIMRRQDSLFQQCSTMICTRPTCTHRHDQHMSRWNTPCARHDLHQHTRHQYNRAAARFLSCSATVFAVRTLLRPRGFDFQVVFVQSSIRLQNKTLHSRVATYTHVQFDHGLMYSPAGFSPPQGGFLDQDSKWHLWRHQPTTHATPQKKFHHLYLRTRNNRTHSR